MTSFADLERRIGRRPAPADRASVESLNDVPEALIDEARQLGSAALAHAWLAYFVSADSVPFLMGFIADVVQGGEAASRWLRGGVLVPDPTLGDQLTKPRQSLLAPIGGFHGIRIVPDPSSWRSGSPSVGAPARAWPGMDYRSLVPEGAGHLSAPRLEAAEDECVTVRRWTAGRIARMLNGGIPTSRETLFARIPALPPWTGWSADGRAAAAMLIDEYRQMGPPGDEIPGFRAADGSVRAAEA